MLDLDGGGLDGEKVDLISHGEIRAPKNGKSAQVMLRQWKLSSAYRWDIHGSGFRFLEGNNLQGLERNAFWKPLST